MRNNYGLWSLSKYKMLMECEMKWALNYYLANRGEFETKHLYLQLAWRLKHMKNVFLLFGDLIHQIIETEIRTLFETGEVLSKTHINKRLSDMLNQSYCQSKSGLEMWYKEPKVNPMLFEIYYNGELNDTTIQFIKKKIEDCISGFMHSETMNKLITLRNVKIMEAEKFRSFYLDGVRVVLSADLIYHDEENDIWGIVDWKSGNQSQGNDIFQLTLYAMYLEKTYGANLSNIIVTNEYLETGTSKSYVLETYHTQSLQNIVLESAMRMAELEEYLHKPDDEVMDVFQKTKNTKLCERCNFKAICLKGHKDLHINNFLIGIGKKEGEKKVKERDIDMMREWVRSGISVDEGYAEFVEESPYETEDSYRSKLERMSELMIGY
jgi:CRISPR/Cas system-associated exonuclease Cas4 (RecB family)